MKIIKDSELLYNLPSKPKTMDFSYKKGVLRLEHQGNEITLAEYESAELGGKILRQMADAYMTDADEFILP